MQYHFLQIEFTNYYLHLPQIIFKIFIRTYSWCIQYFLLQKYVLTTDGGELYSKHRGRINEFVEPIEKY